MTPRRWASIGVGLAVVLITAMSVRAGEPYEGCEPYPITDYSPTGLVGCEVYGEGTASMYGGPGVARNDCQWPWSDCRPIAIQSLETGITIIVVPKMYCDCWLGGTGPNGETARIVDLDPAAVAALGLDPSRGLWPVQVTPFGEAESAITLPDTSMGERP